MTDLVDLQGKLQDTSAAISRARKLLAEDPQDTQFVAVLSSLERRQRRLEEQFLAEANAAGEDVCSYQLDRHGDSFPITALAESLADFQSGLAVVFEAQKSGPKKTAHVSEVTIAQTTLGFSHTFHGSLGLVFTIPNERLLAIESELDRAVETFFQMIHAKTADDLVRWAKELGPAPIRKVHQWALNNAKHGISAAIRWRRNDTVRFEVDVQAAEAASLVSLIAETKPKIPEPHTLVGLLEGGDMVARTFHLSFAEGEDIRGHLAKDYNPLELTLNRRYRARLTKLTTVQLATESEEIHWELNGLEAVD